MYESGYASVTTNMWLLSICRAVAIRGWSGHVCSACVSMLQLGGVGACTPRKFLEFRGYEIASETIFGANMTLLGGQTTLV